MRAAEVISTLQARGVTLQPEGGNVRIKGASRLTAEEKAALKAHKAAILKALDPANQATTDTKPAVAFSCELTEVLSDRRCCQCAYFSPNPNEPPLGGCSMHERIQHADSRPTFFGCGEFQPGEVRP